MKIWIRKKLLAILGVTVALVVFVLVSSFIFYHQSGRAEFEKKFETVKIGDPKFEVLDLLGDPDGRSEEFYLGQERGFENVYQQAEISGSSYYLMWFRGIDFVYTVGFNVKDEVTFAALGGT